MKILQMAIEIPFVANHLNALNNNNLILDNSFLFMFQCIDINGDQNELYNSFISSKLTPISLLPTFLHFYQNELYKHPHRVQRY
jgi:hypothetical protein